MNREHAQEQIDGTNEPNEPRRRKSRGGFGILPTKSYANLLIALDSRYFSFTISPMARTGRPKLAASKRQSRVLALRVTPAEYKKIERAAGKKISAYIRKR